jgi:hypothetical protein
LGLFRRKRTVQVDALCREFYDSNPFEAQIRDVDLHLASCEIIKRTVCEADECFALVDVGILAREILLIRLELFGLAWLHQLGEKHAAAQSAFTKSYLRERDEEDAWAALQPYNAAISRSGTLGLTFETATGRAYLTGRNLAIANAFDAWLERGIEAECVARAANRLCTEVAWKRGITAGFVMLALCERLNCTVNDRAQQALVATIRGFYDGARGLLRQVKVTE